MNQPVNPTTCLDRIPAVGDRPFTPPQPTALTWSLAIRTCGGQRMLKHLPLERLDRDGPLRCAEVAVDGRTVLGRKGRETLCEAGGKDEGPALAARWCAARHVW